MEVSGESEAPASFPLGKQTPVTTWQKDAGFSPKAYQEVAMKANFSCREAIQPGREAGSSVTVVYQSALKHEQSLLEWEELSSVFQCKAFILRNKMKEGRHERHKQRKVSEMLCFLRHYR